MNRGIKYKLLSVPDGGESSEFTITIVIYLEGKEIGFIEEGEPFAICGDFRRNIDTGLVDENNIERFRDNSLGLSVEDLISLQRIILWWNEEMSCDEPTDLRYNVNHANSEQEGKK